MKKIVILFTVVFIVSGLARAVPVLAEVKDVCSSVEECFPLAEQEDADAQALLGYIYLMGINSVEINDQKAQHWFKKAAENGHPKGQEFYASFLLYDMDSKLEQKKEGFQWLKKAANNDNIQAQYTLGTIYNQGLSHYDDKLKKYEEIVEINDNKAFDWFSKAAEQGLRQAQYSLAIMHLNGQGVERNENIAKDLLNKAAVQGSTDAEEMLKMFEYGDD